MMQYKQFIVIAKRIESLLRQIEPQWDGKKAILEMKEGGSTQWKQMEWIGFYFEFLCENLLSPLDFTNSEKKIKYGNVSFDGFLEIPWDFKAHATNTSSHGIIVNDRKAIEKAIADYEAVGIITAIGDVIYNDEDRTFQSWHDHLKGPTSNYVKERIKRGAWSRQRKVLFYLKQICFIKIDNNTLETAGSFQTHFRNADGSSRKEKILLNLEKLKDDDFYTINF